MQRVYLDYNATTPVDPAVIEAMTPYFAGDFGNASSIHWYGQRARAAVEGAREQIASLINARPAEVVFTSGGTESDNTALAGIVEARERAAPHVITSAIEHHAVLHAARALEERGARLTYVPVGSSGIVDPGEIERAIGPDTALISIMHSNNEIGTIQPVEEIGRLAREHDIPFHVDAVQSAGKIPLDVERMNASLLSLSAHKIYGPKGVGALFIRKGTPFRPLLYGGHHERDRRAGTENVAGIVGFGAAAARAAASVDQEANRLGGLRDELERRLIESLDGIGINGSSRDRLPSTSNLRFRGAEGEAMVIALDLGGVACSTGAACSSGSIEPSHVLLALGLTRDEAHSSIRFSLGRFTTREEIEYALEVIPKVVRRLRGLSNGQTSATAARKGDLYYRYVSP